MLMSYFNTLACGAKSSIYFQAASSMARLTLATIVKGAKTSTKVTSPPMEKNLPRQNVCRPQNELPVPNLQMRQLKPYQQIVL